jgi:uncharacterized protein YndB with AHSA1/START domain
VKIINFKMGKNKEKLMNLTMKRQFEAPCEMVFKAWTNAEVIKKWFSPSGNWELSVVKMDLREGGEYRFELRSSDGKTWLVHGKYREIQPSSRLVFTWNTEDVKETVVTVEFNANGNTTEISLTHDLLPNQAQVEEHTWGWQGCMENLSVNVGGKNCGKNETL